MPTTISFSRHIDYYKVNWDEVEVRDYPIHDSMKRYVDALCCAARFRISSGTLLEHDTSWDRGTTSSPETMRRFYYLQSRDLAIKEPPLPTREQRILFWSHATDIGALHSMLKDRHLLPMRAHGAQEFGCNVFYALGHEVTGSEADEYSMSRALYNCTRSAKNLAHIVAAGKSWGSRKKVYGGSYATAKEATETDDTLKDSNAKAFCVSRNKYIFSAIAFEQLALPPNTAGVLISQYEHAARLRPQKHRPLL